MTTITRRLLPLATLFALSAPTAASAQDTFDILGPAPKPGLTVSTTGKMTMKNAEFSLKTQGMTIDGTMDMTADHKSVRRILAVKDGRPTRVETHVLREHVAQTMTLFGTEETEEGPEPLAGTTILSELTDDGWKHSLLDDLPTEEQKVELNEFTATSDDTALYPKGRVTPGHTWDMKASDWAEASGGMGLTAVTGVVKSRFVKVVEFKGQRCALIEQDIDAKGQLSMPGEDEIDVDMSLNVKATTHRSLDGGIDLKVHVEGEVTMSGKFTEDGQEMELTVNGKIVADDESEPRK